MAYHFRRMVVPSLLSCLGVVAGMGMIDSGNGSEDWAKRGQMMRYGGE